jgi:alcohol dehydrogenase class IV
MNQYANKFSIFIPDTLIGVGAVDDLGSIVKGLKANKVLIATDGGLVKAGLIDKVKRPLENEGIEYGMFDGCLPDAPFSVIEHCARMAKEGGYDLMIALGGGSVIDTVKAASILATGDGDIYSYLGQYKVYHSGLPTIMIPTTAGTAAEWTWAAVITDDSKGVKRSIYSHYLHPKAVIIDPLLTVALPRNITAETGMDALIHGIEAYTTWKSNVMSDMFAEQTIKLAAGNLRAAYGKGSKNIEARYNMAVAAALGFCFIFSGLGLAHAMAYPLQLKSQISHGVSCSILLPFVMEYNMPVDLHKYARIAELMGEEVEGLSLRDKAIKSTDAVRKLSIDVEMPQRMRDVGVKKEDIPSFVDNVLTFQPHVVDANPRDASKEAIAKIFEAAW